MVFNFRLSAGWTGQTGSLGEKLTANALLEVEFNHAETLLISREGRIEIQAETLCCVGRHDHTVVELHCLGRSRVVRIGVHAESEVDFVDVRGDADDVCVAGFQTGRINLDLGLCRWGLCFFAHVVCFCMFLRVEGGFDN